jgi:enterochelin esterase-like enzyme
MPRRSLLISLLSLVAWAAPAPPKVTPGPLRFRITLARGAAAAPVGGRLLVFMTDEPAPREELSIGFYPGSVAVAALEFESIAPGETVDFDPDVLAYPQPFSKAKPASYQFMALLDRDHTYVQAGDAADDLLSPVVRIENLDPSNSRPLELTLNRHGADRRKRPEATEDVKVVEYESPLLTRFWGRPVTMRAGVVLPPSYSKEPERRYPAMYVHHGFGGSHREAFGEGLRMRKEMERRKAMDAVLVFLDGSCPTGDHEFADSANNGPWGRALTEEFIPYLETHFRLVAKPSARFLTGHSSGGWASLHLEVTYPDFFGGTWSTAPDPVDFRSFSGIDATPGSKDNAYRTPDGKPHGLVRMDGKDVAGWEQFARQEEVLGEYGGQIASFEWVFSPRGPGGTPMRLFNRVTGTLDQDVLRAWQKYDIRLTLERQWPELAPKLKGKLNILCGDQDTFHLDEAVKLLCGFLKEKGSDAVCEIVPGRTHMNLYAPYKTYPDGLDLRIAREMQAKFEAANR